MDTPSVYLYFDEDVDNEFVIRFETAALTERADLVETLSGDGSFTVFAPNNAAFAEFLDGAALEDIPVEDLRQVLLNHVLGSELTSSQLSTGYVDNLADVSTYVNISSGVVINGVSTVTQADIDRSNGVIHAVDEVIPLPTLLTFAAADTDLGTLATVATTTAGFTTDFGAVLGDADGDLTLLAPDNAAFTELGDISGVPASAIEQILLNHVIAGTNLSTDLSTGYGNTLATYGDSQNNLSIYINTSSGVSFNGISDVTTPDVKASNGVIHKVDAVITLPTVVTFATADENFSTLVSALTTLTPSVDFVDVLSTELGTDPAPFTVFAPINAAFDALAAIPGEMDLIPILQHHVIGGANVRSGDLSDGLVTPATLEGDVLTVSIPGTNGAVANLTDGTGNDDIEILAVDVQAANGVIHAIGKVLIPDTTN